MADALPYASATGTSSASSQVTTDNTGPLSEKVLKLVNEKKAGREFQLRKHVDWNENYELYRGKVKTNRLTQRQTVNVPLMKETIKTLLSKVDDPPDVRWQELSGDQMKELIYQEMWDKNFREEDLELKDVVDKKNVFMFGLSTKKLNLKEDGVCVDIMDTFDIVYDPQTLPFNVESARFIIHQNIFKSLREILVDPRYSKEGKAALKDFIASPRGIVQSGRTRIEWEKKLERLKTMGIQNEKFPVFAGGDVVVNLCEHFTNMWNTKTQKWERRVVTIANDSIELSDDLLKDCIGIEEWPFDMWCEDPETNDVYPDGVADLVRTPNKLLNIWFSQQVENRTLQNFQMHWFDSTVQGYQPQTYEPGPGRMLPAPGDPSKTIMPVAINGLDETFAAMNYLIGMVERGTGATAIEKGQPESGQQTLGEVQILVGKATERAKMMSKFYKASWYRTAKKWDAMMQANSFPKITLYKTGQDGKIYDKVVYNSDWKSKAGYEPVVQSSSEQESDAIQSVQKFAAVMQQSPNNSALKQIALKRELKILDLTPAELSEVLKEEEMLAQQAMTPQQGVPGQPQPAAPQEAPAPSPQETGLVEQVKQKMAQLA